MKPSGYIMISEKGSVSGTAHKCSLDFWKPKKEDKLEVMYKASDLLKELYLIAKADESMVYELVDELICRVSVQQESLLRGYVK